MQPSHQILKKPNEFAHHLTNVSSSFLGLPDGGIITELAQDLNFPLKNAPLETYAKHYVRFLPSTYVPRYENTTMGGERASQIYVNGKDVAIASAVPESTNNIETLSYLVMHNDQPYFLNYIANAKHYQKYLPQVEQMVNTFKFTK